MQVAPHAPVLDVEPDQGKTMTEQRPIAGARALLRQCRYASLATLTADGAPFASLVAMSSDASGAPLLLLSDLARHSKNIAGDTRVSLLLDGTGDDAERLSGSRLTLAGTLETCARDDDLQRRYLAQHSNSAMLLEMSDFHFYRMTVKTGHLVAGFGRIDTIAPDDLLVAPQLVQELAAIEQGAMDHIADDHADAVAVLGGSEELTRLLAIDADGMSLVAGARPVRVMFSARIDAAPQLRTAIAKVVRQIRRNLG
jgi:heme iron utilization protein